MLTDLRVLRSRGLAVGLFLATLLALGGTAFAEGSVATTRASARDVMRPMLDPFPPHPLELADPIRPIYGTWLASIVERVVEHPEFGAPAPEPALPAVAPEALPDGLGAVLASDKKAVERCVQWATRQAGEQSGRLVVRIHVERNGAVSRVEVEENQLSPELTSCLRKRAMAWALPEQRQPLQFTHLWVF